jgi:hypothetical protein
MYEDRVDPDRVLDPAERAMLARNAMHADMARARLAAIQARRRAAKKADAERLAAAPPESPC